MVGPNFQLTGITIVRIVGGAGEIVLYKVYSGGWRGEAGDAVLFCGKRFLFSPV